MQKIFRFGLIGCGRISRNHFQAIKNNSDRAELIAVCDSVEERAEKAGEENIIPYYTNLDEMLDNEKIDVLSVCTPSSMHTAQGIKAAARGIHVLSEKPIGTSLNEVDRLIKISEENSVKLFVVKQNRLNPALKLLKSAIDKGRFGKLYMSVVNVFWTRPQEYYDSAVWRGTWEFDGGAFLNQASHYIDLIEWLIGSPESVIAYTATLARRIQAEDTGAAVIKFRNGCIGSVNVTMLTYPQNIEGSIAILGEKGTVKIGGTALNRIEHWEFQNYDDDDKYIYSAKNTSSDIQTVGHTEYYKNVLDVLETDTGAYTDGKEGRKSLELILAIYKSSNEGRSISLPLESY